LTLFWTLSLFATVWY